MENNLLDAVWLDDSDSCTIVHLAEVSGLDRAELQMLVDSGALTPLPETGDSLAFASAAMSAALTARRLRDDFELNPSGLALAMRLLGQMQTLERELEHLRAGKLRPQAYG